MQPTTKLIILAILGSMLTGCALLQDDENMVHDRANAYIYSQNGKLLEIPPDLQNSVHLSQNYVVKKRQPQSEINTLLEPPGSLAAARVKTNVVSSLRIRPALEVSQLHIAEQQGQLALTIDRPLADAWLDVGSAIKRQHLALADREKANRTYLIVANGKDRRHIYQIYLQGEQNKTHVYVFDSQGNPAPKSLTQDIFARLSDGLLGRKNNNLSQLIKGW
ncbi:MAG: hypothetical protein Tsb005_07840 [Gammaproteobacteria bacterium]